MVSKIDWNKRHSVNYYSYLQSDKFKCIYEYASFKILEATIESVLDVGCWTGMLADALLDSGFDGKYLGTDISDKALREAAESYRYQPKFQFMQSDFNGPPPRGRYDAMYFGGVFYFIEDKTNFLNKFIENNDPSVIVIQDLASTDLGFINDIDCIKRDLEYFDLPINAHGNSSRNRRQVHTIKLK